MRKTFSLNYDLTLGLISILLAILAITLTACSRVDLIIKEIPKPLQTPVEAPPPQPEPAPSQPPATEAIHFATEALLTPSLAPTHCEKILTQLKQNPTPRAWLAFYASMMISPQDSKGQVIETEHLYSNALCFRPLKPQVSLLLQSTPESDSTLFFQMGLGDSGESKTLRLLTDLILMAGQKIDETQTPNLKKQILENTLLINGNFSNNFSESQKTILRSLFCRPLGQVIAQGFPHDYTLLQLENQVDGFKTTFIAQCMDRELRHEYLKRIKIHKDTEKSKSPNEE